MRLIDADAYAYPGDLINEPTVEAEPVKHAHAVLKHRTVGGYKYINVECKACGSTVRIETEHPVNTNMPYCSDCGMIIFDAAQPRCAWCGAYLDEEVE